MTAYCPNCTSPDLVWAATAGDHDAYIVISMFRRVRLVRLVCLTCGYSREFVDQRQLPMLRETFGDQLKH